MFGKSMVCIAAIGVLLSPRFIRSSCELTEPPSRVRIYFIAADEIVWDYAPTGQNDAMGRTFNQFENQYFVGSPTKPGRACKKAVFREYTDATFSKLQARPPDQQYLGILGPLIRAEVGDTIKVVFRNNASRPYSMHPHGVMYEKKS